MSSQYQTLYNQQREREAVTIQEHRKKFFNHARKERRTQTFDIFRGDFAACKSNEIKPVPKFTFRDTIHKLLREKKKKVATKSKPFVVGTVKHKLHSPPFLHEAYRLKEIKKKLTPLQLKSFAPSNYKFKAPKGLETCFATPLGEEQTDACASNSFALNTIWNKLDNMNTNQNDLIHSHITLRTHKKKCAYLNSSLNSVSSVVTTSGENESGERNNARRELWPEGLNEKPVFGRLNLARQRKSCDNQPKDDEKEASDFDNSVMSNTSFLSNREPKKKLNQTLEPLVHFNLMPMSASMESPSHPDASPNAVTSGPSNKYETQFLNHGTKIGMMDFRVSQISPPKTILSNNIYSFDNSGMHMGIENINFNDNHLPCSTCSLPDLSKTISEQVEKFSDSSSTTILLPQEDTVKLVLPKNKNVSSEHDNSTTSAVQESPIKHNHSKTNKDINSTVSTVQESPSKHNGSKTDKDINSTSSSVQESPIKHNCSKTNEDISFIAAPVQKSQIKYDLKTDKHMNSTASTVQEVSIKHNDSKINNISSIAGPVQESPIENNDSKTDKDMSLTASPVQESPLKHNSSKTGNSNLKVMEEPLDVLKNRSKTLNITFTKCSILKEEDEQDEDFEVNLEKSHIEDNTKSSVSPPVLNSSNVNKQHVDSENVNKVESYSNSFDSTQTSKNLSAEIEDYSNTNGTLSLSKSNLQGVYTDQTLNTTHESVVNHQESPEEKINQFITSKSSTSTANLTVHDKDESLNNSSKLPAEIPSLLKSSLQDSCNEETISSIQETLIHSRESSNKKFHKCGDSSLDVDSNQTNLNNDENSSKTLLFSKSSSQDYYTEESTDAIQENAVHSQKFSEKQVNECIDSLSEFVPNQTNFNKDESLNNSSKIPSFSKSRLQNDLTEQTADANQENAIHSRESPNKQVSECIDSSSDFLICQINLNKDGHLLEAPNELDPKINSGNFSSEKVNDLSQAQKDESLMDPTDSKSNGFENQSIEVNFRKLPTKGNNIDNCDPGNLSSVNTSYCRITEDKNESLNMDVDSYPGATGANQSSPNSNTEKKNDIATKTQHPPKPTATEKINFDPVLSKTDTLRKLSSASNIAIKIDFATEFENSMVKLAGSDHVATTGSVQIPVAAHNENVIDLTDSPVTPNRKSTNPELRKSVLGYKSSLLLSNQKKNRPSQSSNENIVIDLISDDEDNYTSYLNSLLKKYAVKSKSPIQSPRNRTPLASIGNIQRLSACRTAQSPLVNQVNSPSEKTPVFLTEPISVNVSPCLEPSEVLASTPRKTPRRRNVMNDIAAGTEEVPSPLRVMRLRNRNISVSLSPQKNISRKNSPCNTPVKRKVEKVVENSNLLSVINLKMSNDSGSPPAKEITSCKTPVKDIAMKEVVLEPSEGTSHSRVMNLRSRTVNVSPSPKKMTPRRKK